MMNDKTDYVINTQKAANDGMKTFLNWGNAAIDNTFSMYEQGIETRDTNIAEARKQFQELESSLTQKWENQKEQFKSMTIELSQAYWPGSRQLMEQVEKFFENNINVVIHKNREMLESSIDSSVKINLNVERKWVAQLRENYARGSENLRKQFDMLEPRVTPKNAKPEVKAKEKIAEETPAKQIQEKTEVATVPKYAETKVVADKAKTEVKAKEIIAEKTPAKIIQEKTEAAKVPKYAETKVVADKAKTEVKAKKKNAEETPAKKIQEKTEAATVPKYAEIKVVADKATAEVKAKKKNTEVVSEAKSAVKKTPAAEISQPDRDLGSLTDNGTPATAPKTEPLTLRSNPDFSGNKLRKELP